MEIREGVVDGLYYNLVDITPPWVKSPETIIFHHGVGAISDVYADWIPVLGGRYRILRFDMRGMGRSAEGARNDRLTFDTAVDDVLKVADAVGVDRMHFVGESFGGTVVLVAGLRHPKRFQTLTVSNASHLGSTIRNIGEWESKLNNEGGAAWSAMMMKDRFYDGALPPEKSAWYEMQQASHPKDSIIAGLHTLVAADLRERLSSLDVPVLLLHGDASPFVTVDMTADLHMRLPKSELQIFAHARHGLPFSHGRQSAEVVRDFMARHS
jgi:pimeloyl-ACP methyl ester carboxylesterase